MKISDYIEKFHIVELIFLIVAASILFNLLLMEPIIGLADHGDYFRLMSKVGLCYLTDDPQERYFWYLNRDYGYVTPLDVPYITSEELFVRIAVLADNLVTRDRFFSITALGIIHGLFFLCGLLLLLYSVGSLRKMTRGLLCGLLLFVFCDVGYVAWFNSLYSEPASQIFLLFSICIAYLSINRSMTTSKRFLLALGFWAAVLGFITAKPQNGPCGLILFALGCVLIVAFPASRRSKMILSAAILPGVLLVGVGLFLTFSGQASYMKEANLYNVVFADLLKYSPHPENDMKELGIYHSEYMKLIGRDRFTDPDPIVETERFREDFNQSIGYGKILKFYLLHPSRFYRLIDRVSNQSYTMRPPAMGNFEHSAAPIPTDEEGAQILPAEPLQTQVFSYWSRFKLRLFPRSGLFLIGWFMFLCLVFILKIIWFDRNRRETLSTLIPLSLLFMAMLQFLTAIIGEGEVAIIKHLYLFNVLFDATFIVLVLYIASLLGVKEYRQKVATIFRKRKDVQAG